MATFDPTRLYSTLLNTGLQVKDNALYQVIHDLIAALATVNKQTNSLAASSSTPATITNIIQQQLTESSDFGTEEFQVINNSSVTNVVNNINNVVQQLTEFSSDLSALDDFQIPGPIGPAGPIVPYFIGVNEVFLVPIFKQALFAMNIEVQGTLEVDGFLIEVDNIANASIWTPTDASGAGLSFSGVSAYYVKIGPLVWINFVVQYPVTASGANAKIGSLPFMVSAAFGALSAGFTNSSLNITYYVRENSTNIEMFLNTGAAVTNAQLSGAIVEGAGIYQSV